MIIWRFRCFVSANGRNVISHWYEDLSPKEQADFDAEIEIWRKQVEWDSRDFERLKGQKYKSLFEHKFKSCGKQHRILGCFGPEPRQYTFLLGCTHKGKIYDPPEAFDTALRRKSQLAQDIGHLSDDY
ncbi:MAG TPA: hypothetical protein VJ646_07115 [Candidatus Binatia bacterium]|nr:hypothetical protein [Candidatus Binatia bacterium]